MLNTITNITDILLLVNYKAVNVLKITLTIIDEQNITPVPLLDLATNKPIIQNGSKSVNGSIELAIWHKENEMTVHIYQCKGLLRMSLCSHDYVQIVLLEDNISQIHVSASNKTRRFTPIVSGKKRPEFHAKITVSFFLFYLFVSG